jgi:GAF domain-containing protein
VTERASPTHDSFVVFFSCLGTWRLRLARARSLLPVIRRETRETAALREVAAIAASATPTSDPLQRILEAALPALPSGYLVLLHVSIDRSESVIVAAAGTAHIWRWLRAPLGRGLAARAIDTREVQVGSDAVGAPDTAAGPSRLDVVVPVILQGGVFGVLTTADEGRRFTERHVALLRAFADQCAIGIDNNWGRKSRRGFLDYQ